MSLYPDIRQMRAFVSIAETGSFTKAAQLMNLTQSAISHSIKTLEEQLGVRLIERTGKRLSITQDGSMYLKRCMRVMEELDQAQTELTNLKLWSQGRIRIGATHSMVTYVLPSVIREFRECFPRCEISIEAGDSATLLTKLDSAEIDYAFGMKAKTLSWCQYEPLFSDEIGFVTSPIHPWASQNSVDLSDFNSTSFLVYGKPSETFRLIRNQVEKLGIKLRIAMSLGDMEAIKCMSKIGLGVGMVAPWVAKKELETGELKFLRSNDIQIKREWGVFYHDTKHKTLPESTFLGISRLVCEQLMQYEH